MKRPVNMHRYQILRRHPTVVVSSISQTFKYARLAAGITFLLLVLLTASIQNGWTHGGKTHTEFTTLQALQKTTDLYNQLIEKGKLDESWETGLVQVVIKPPGAAGNTDFIVQFSKKEGDPKTVFFFLTDEGQYAGSNYTGP